MASYIELDENASLPSASGPGRVVLGVNDIGALTITDSNGDNTLNTQVLASTGSNTFVGDQVIVGALAQGLDTSASGQYSHAEGRYTTASGEASHAEGSRTLASNSYAHAEGRYTTASRWQSHAEGNRTHAGGISSHAEGDRTVTLGEGSHAEGSGSVALGDYSHAEGIGTIASGSYQHVSGKYNLQDNTASLFVIGNGINDGSRSDVVRIETSGLQVTGSVNVSGSIYAPNLNGAITNLSAPGSGGVFNYDCSKGTTFVHFGVDATADWDVNLTNFDLPDGCSTSIKIIVSNADVSGATWKITGFKIGGVPQIWTKSWTNGARNTMYIYKFTIVNTVSGIVAYGERATTVPA